MSKAFVKDDGESLEEDLPHPDDLLEAEGPHGKRYITPEGFKVLQDELDWLWKEERPKITNEVMWAAAQGDRSENAEYIYGKKRLREIDRRVRFLTRRLESLTVVESSPEQQGVVRFGAWVTVEDEEGETRTYRIVGPDEFDVKEGKISVDSPLAKALLGKKLDDEAHVKRPKGDVTLTVLEIRYE